jgi:hypothetical protein
MSAELDGVASLFGMQEVFRLRALDICRFLHAEAIPSGLDA